MSLKPVARLGDRHRCPKCKSTNSIATASSGVVAGGKPVATVGDKTECGATIIEGAIGFNSNKLVAYLGCKTDHGGEIISADSNNNLVDVSRGSTSVASGNSVIMGNNVNIGRAPSPFPYIPYGSHSSDTAISSSNDYESSDDGNNTLNRTIKSSSSSATVQHDSFSNEDGDEGGEDNKKCQFTVLDRHIDGVGPYHLNTTIAFFDAPDWKRDDNFIADKVMEMFINFDNNFSENNRAKCKSCECFYNNEYPTVKFTALGNINFVHDDWVYMSEQRKNFYATTLKREWKENVDKNIEKTKNPFYNRFLPPGIREIVQALPVEKLIELNQLHALAGKRSWAIGVSPWEGTAEFFIETATCERYSDEVFLNIFEKLEEVSNVHDEIVKLWAVLLVNTINMFVSGHSSYGVANIFPEELTQLSNYKELEIGQDGERALYQIEEVNNVSQIQNVKWFNDLLIRHPGLYD